MSKNEAINAVKELAKSLYETAEKECEARNPEWLSAQKDIITNYSWLDEIAKYSGTTDSFGNAAVSLEIIEGDDDTLTKLRGNEEIAIYSLLKQVTKRHPHLQRLNDYSIKLRFNIAIIYWLEGISDESIKRPIFIKGGRLSDLKPSKRRKTRENNIEITVDY